jgi:hypothetical protein
MHATVQTQSSWNNCHFVSLHEDKKNRTIPNSPPPPKVLSSLISVITLLARMNRTEIKESWLLFLQFLFHFRTWRRNLRLFVYLPWPDSTENTVVQSSNRNGNWRVCSGCNRALFAVCHTLCCPEYSCNHFPAMPRLTHNPWRPGLETRTVFKKAIRRFQKQRRFLTNCCLRDWICMYVASRILNYVSSPLGTPKRVLFHVKEIWFNCLSFKSRRMVWAGYVARMEKVNA